MVETSPDQINILGYMMYGYSLIFYVAVTIITLIVLSRHKFSKTQTLALTILTILCLEMYWSFL